MGEAEQTKTIELTKQAGNSSTGQRLDRVAAELFTDFSRARLQMWIRNGLLTVDGKKARPSQRLGGGEQLRLCARPEPETEVIAQDLPLDILHADEHILLINKPAGLVVHPAAGNPDGTMQNALLFFDPGLAVIPRSGIVHRLDKDTTGVLVVARSLKAHASLVAQLQERRMSRVYEAIARGRAGRSGTVNEPIGRHPVDRKRMAVVANGKPAVSHYRLLRAFDGFSHLEVSLESGRTHQIRVHMSHIGLPLVGDPQYGRGASRKTRMSQCLRAALTGFPRQALHARTLTLTHPDSERTMSFTAPLPEDFSALLETLAEEAP
jgi:23S rRNA pseudouridine1911/1915/1917 synthase